ncbi:MAG: hypothetical protein LBU95_04055 [Rikenellaceae bacterium]|jgi:hypothetical protein|nr:hypothetical protein [Rikenellaceae bacterium]
MKKYLMIFTLAALVLAGCNKNENESEPGQLVYTEGGVNYIGNGDQNFYAPAGDYYLDASQQYVLRGWVYIQDGSSLHIPAGTVIFGKSTDNTVKGSSLVICRGGKIFAEGTATKPVVFTSDKPAGLRKSGDWGGIIICGRAKNNQGTMMIEGGPNAEHGGSNDTDDSGVLKYVRIEFAGFPLEPDKEINGLTMGSVGSATELHHVQVSYSNDDSFEWFGGAVNCDHLVAYHNWDDDFDTDNGFSGRVQFALGVRHPKIADTSCSNGFESDNDANGSTSEPFTTAQFCNVTLIGPIGQDDAFVNQTSYITAGALNPNNGSQLGQFQAGFQIRRGSKLSILNSAVMGWPVGAIIDSEKGQSQAYAGDRDAVRNVFFGGYTDNAVDAKFNNAATGGVPVLGADRNKKWEDALCVSGATDLDITQKSFTHSYVLTAGRGNQCVNSLGLGDPRSVTGGSFTPNAAANFGPATGSVLVNASLTVPAGFDTAGNGFAGAFKSDAAADNWMAGWTNFDPQNTVY